MRNTSRALILLFAALAWDPRVSGAADADFLADVTLTVRTYDNAGLSPAERDTTLAVAAGILRGAGLQVSWTTCDAVFVRDRNNDPCLAPLAPTELAVRFVTFPPPPGKEGTLPLGYSLVDTRRRSGSLATLYVDRVAGLAFTCQIDTGTLLGRAVAHEIGHLLLGDRSHGGSGLMRALWSREAIAGSGEEKWQFSMQEGQKMRSALRSRRAEHMALNVLH
jgi:hypothetical protein